MKHAVNIELPRATSQPQDTPPQAIRLTVDAQGQYYWNDALVTDNELADKLQAEAARPQQPELHVRGDRDARYERVAQAMAVAQRSGLHKIGFITEPQTK